MKNGLLNKIASFLAKGISFLQGKKKALYKNEKKSHHSDLIRIAIGIVLCLVVVYVGAIAFIYGVILAVVAIAIYFLLPPDFLEKNGINLSNLLEDKENKKDKK